MVVDPDVAPSQAKQQASEQQTAATSGESQDKEKQEALEHPPKIFEQHPGKKPHLTSPVLIIVMGVSGCGKSTVGERIANKFRIRFVDGDALHPKSNIDKMSQGIPLNDEVCIWRYCNLLHSQILSDLKSTEHVSFMLDP